MSLERANEFTDKLEALCRDYHDVLDMQNDVDEWAEDHGHAPPDWDYPLSIQHWVLVLAVDDNSETRRGYWRFGMVPPHQRPYITLGLLTEYLEGF